MATIINRSEKYLQKTSVAGDIPSGTGGEGGAGAVGGGTDQVFYENDQVVTVDYIITEGKNAVTAGPVTINDGITVEVPDGSSWVIV